jgi:hypothetical protein
VPPHEEVPVEVEKVVVEAQTKKVQEIPPPIDFKVLFKLQEDHANFKRQARIYRLLFSVLCGCWFHLLFHSFHLYSLTWHAFLFFDLAFVATLTFHEKTYYTRPINVSPFFLLSALRLLYGGVLR